MRPIPVLIGNFADIAGCLDDFARSLSMHSMHQVFPQASRVLWMDTERHAVAKKTRRESGMVINNRDSGETEIDPDGGIGRIAIRHRVIRAAD